MRTIRPSQPPPTDEYFGDTPPFLVLAASLGFFAAGVHLLSNFIRTAAGLPRLSGCIFGDIVAVSIAIPLHWWLFFGKATAGSAIGLTVGGVTIFTTANLPFGFILAKIAVAVLCIVLDLYLASEIFGSRLDVQ